MRHVNIFTALSAVGVLGATVNTQAQGVAAFVVERGSNYRNWQSVGTITGADGKMSLKTNTWIELGNGLCYRDPNGQWQDSQDLIELDANTAGAEARRGPTKVTFSPTVSGGVMLASPEGVRLQARVLGIFYADPTTGRNVVVASVKESEGTFYPPNMVGYEDCFSGLKASLRYVYTAGIFDQMVVLLAALPTPESLGLSSNSCRVQVWTSFRSSVAPTVQLRTLKTASGPQAGLPTGTPALIDQVLRFGDLWFPTGGAFDSSESPPAIRISPLSSVCIRRAIRTRCWWPRNGFRVSRETTPSSRASIIRTLLRCSTA